MNFSCFTLVWSARQGGGGANHKRHKRHKTGFLISGNARMPWSVLIVPQMYWFFFVCLGGPSCVFVDNSF